MLKILLEACVERVGLMVRVQYLRGSFRLTQLVANYLYYSKLSVDRYLTPDFGLHSGILFFLFFFSFMGGIFTFVLQ